MAQVEQKAIKEMKTIQKQQCWKKKKIIEETMVYILELNNAIAEEFLSIRYQNNLDDEYSWKSLYSSLLCESQN